MCLKSVWNREFHSLMNFKRLIKGIQSLEELFFPALCYICGNEIPEDRKIICRICWHDLPRYSDENFEKYLPKIYHNLFILYRYDSTACQLIHLLKYERRLSLAVYFAESLVKCFPRLLHEGYHFLLPVPLYKARKRERGYNQSETVCRFLSPLIQTPYHKKILIRTRNTKSQTNLNKAQRVKNVDNAFLCNFSLENANILLLDDVITTGSTVNACASALLNAGAKKVDVVVLAG
jgi:competence protein ComFC